ncbi:MAG: type I methionyl aminopeptidase [Candidatus Lloydbacteria bacterium CG22_combo_CG10-13_8_21_14_all_47_15]|uniref:Methionine aminopeptidase n=1 Tax=Candidatus Lloydbacteria bacterium CG22_combo_CG10-13_8_21_14_all_47_15 TaxID=1974635 RepID=A0A2H0CTS7_9BACT|nr:MAG: type I methionyl aminopeptidase [Candidatus Lloydbacteria bacterium CG22_combo_CG10-13_8_21_14_all_47_15]
MIIRNKKEEEIIREAGRRLARVLAAVKQAVRPGVTTEMLDEIAEKLIRDNGDIPAFKGYQPDGAEYPYPATLCTSVNDEIVHGIPGGRELKEGDIIGLDIGLTHDGLTTDMAETVAVGAIDADAKQLMDVTRGALAEGIAAARAGGRTGDIGHAIEAYVKEFGAGYGIVRELGGHGVGRLVHERPYIPNFGALGDGDELIDGMVIALEPMLTEKGEHIFLADDGYTFQTKNGARSAHFEHTIIVRSDGGEVVTRQ